MFCWSYHAWLKTLYVWFLLSSINCLTWEFLIHMRLCKSVVIWWLKKWIIFKSIKNMLMRNSNESSMCIMFALSSRKWIFKASAWERRESCKSVTCSDQKMKSRSWDILLRKKKDQTQAFMLTVHKRKWIWNILLKEEKSQRHKHCALCAQEKVNLKTSCFRKREESSLKISFLADDRKWIW